MIVRRARMHLAVALVVSSASRVAVAQIPQPLIDRGPARAETHHVGTFGGTRVPYTALVEEHVLRGSDSIPSASLITIAYLREAVNDPTTRPVAFVFNGGPGSSSSPLHMNGMGPRLVSGDSTVPNAESILDATDLVFIDPVGTGFSRPYTTEVGRRAYWTSKGDAAAVAQVIERWLDAHGRRASPRYLIGESYGTVRAGWILHARPQLQFDGVLLISVAAFLRNGGREMPQVAAFTAMATSAWYHQRVPRAGRTVEQVYREAVDFARTDYLTALVRGASLPAAERERVAARMSQFIALPTDFILERRLRISKDDWMLNVLRSDNLRTGMLDTRITAPRDTTRTGGLNDPALAGGRLRIGTAMLAPSVVPGSAQAMLERPDTTAPPTPLERYLRRDLQFPTLESYRSLNLDINGVWTYDAEVDAFEAVGEAMKRFPRMRMAWMAGYFDLTTPAYESEYIFDQVGIPSDRTTALVVPGAHGSIADPTQRPALARALRAWIR